ncbi:hypothetical protein DFH07DRAFT_973525 [Mycena maculata]|uniref:Uncharacterized protein n=1 Tax=Mycena maculata TaxID=230809 RepID=A0AAD7HCK7_9AGAR|nr:hypothetical protein DFH07DRAFT_973525 [Mycena maculata]
MHCTSSLALVFTLVLNSMVAAAPVAPVSAIISSSSSSEVAMQSPSTATVAISPEDILPVQSETYTHAPEFARSAEKSPRRSYRRRHP